MHILPRPIAIIRGIERGTTSYQQLSTPPKPGTGNKPGLSVGKATRFRSSTERVHTLPESLDTDVGSFSPTSNQQTDNILAMNPDNAKVLYALFCNTRGGGGEGGG